MVVLFALALEVCAAPAEPANTNSNIYPIDLPAALRLAGARNLDIQIARERLNEARANHQSAVEQFFPWVSPGVGYHRRDGLAQAVPSGIVTNADFQSYSPGATLSAEIALGNAIYTSLAARQLVKASDQALESQRQGAILNAAQGYFDLARAKALVEVARQAADTSADYQQQLHAAVGAGIAFRGDELRVQTQTERYQISARQALEQQRLIAASLAQVLHLDPSVELLPQDGGLTALTLYSTNAPLAELVQRALRTRPELKEGQALISAARTARKGATYGPLIPSVGAQVFAGGLGGGPDHGPSNFGAEQDYLLSAMWRVGPGGLLDFGRLDATKARQASVELTQTKLQDTVTAEVVSNLARIQSLADQIALSEKNLATATETLRLTRERKQYGVGVVLEDIQAQQDLVRARSDYITALAEFNKAQYGLGRAVGGL
jgi:outer membrane protein TolC